jgi:hypothetical protein
MARSRVPEKEHEGLQIHPNVERIHDTIERGTLCVDGGKVLHVKMELHSLVQLIAAISLRDIADRGRRPKL